MRTIWILGLALLVSGCAGLDEEWMNAEDRKPDSVSRVDSDLSRIQFEIQRLVDQATCNSAAQCRTVAVGHKPCGGARYYYAYSVTDTDTTRLLSLVADYDRLEKERAVTPNEIATCRVIEDPGADCVTNRCVTKPYKF